MHACEAARSHACTKDTLGVGLVDGLVGLVDVLHGDGVGELVEHPLLESLQPLVVMAAAHKLLVLQRREGRREEKGGEEKHGVSLTSSGHSAHLHPGPIWAGEEAVTSEFGSESELSVI